MGRILNISIIMAKWLFFSNSFSFQFLFLRISNIFTMTYIHISPSHPFNSISVSSHCVLPISELLFSYLFLFWENDKSNKCCPIYIWALDHPLECEKCTSWHICHIFNKKWFYYSNYSPSIALQYDMGLCQDFGWLELVYISYG